MKALRLILSMSVFAFLLQGCSVSSSQFSSLVSVLRSSQADPFKGSWTVSYGSYQAEIFAVLKESEILFLNKLGDSLVFDGWVIKEVSGLGINRADWKVQVTSESRRFLHKDRLVAEHLCGAWHSEKSYGMTKFSQDCQSFTSYRNSILVDNQGFITLIRQAVDGSDALIKLNKNR